MSQRFQPEDTAIPGLTLLTRSRFGDERGFLSRLFCGEELAAFGWPGPVLQVNETGTVQKGTVRGLHFQHAPFGEWKLVTCVEGTILDVALDLRKGSSSFLQHVCVELSGDNCRSLLIPPGFAHGFQALSDTVRMIYTHSAPYRAEAEGGLHPQDARIGITWPLPVERLSARDQSHPLIQPDFEGLIA
ncbi:MULTISPECIES: dTDP-4-dehydrorhamnose 3,5-epimerase family protein [Rhizobium/Agrobacterium group]|uniref:dTDP-4-dehydrorhamnose 3,5-epimerase n=2 Tax=Rhizobium/Agrobacterium group TaxID=227290 RepID=B9JR35_ALLAM|nr:MULTISPECIES: dTDP-4-dehydrorhamnose 3,5-epimerase family protein [Rhizobium/Agrobacterium group]ACM35448.1 dTDP-4-dehydrorhamnose 3,5-epimerase [Allorhizobium ampelinum S4]MUO28236.1 dTDP-4-dehydrorhamnose 3,5-epimerase [Agrobacterium vitis]MUO40730.1 dTDP-4-dehydrorhamnose 3,5-epimerase [Agrobacterium vitis]MUP12731.1 dTDP-4-dehydrorhamnose 3,5-epimerase [Agrobacterium vitis]